MTIPVTELALEAARRGGAAILEARDRPREITSKGFRDEVTDADYAAQAAILAAIHEHYPQHRVVSEENDFGHRLANWQPPEEYWWLVDPLDGTTNYSRDIPHYCVSVAVLRGTTLIGGAIYDPNRGHLFAAGRGEGATLNGAPLRVSDRGDLAEAILEIGLARNREVRRQGLALFAALAPECRTVRTSGSAALALAWVAAGWLDGYVHLTLRPWDSAAGGLMIQEAGGRLSLPQGGEWRAQLPPILATNDALHDTVLTLTQQTLSNPK